MFLPHTPVNESYLRATLALLLNGLSLTSHCMTSWWRWDLWRQMNFSLRDNKVVNRIEKRSNGVETLHLSSASELKSVGESVSVSEEMKCLSRVTDLCTDAFHQWLAITLTPVKQTLHPNWHPSVLRRQNNHEMAQTNVEVRSRAMSTRQARHLHTHIKDCRMLLLNQA